MSRKRRIIPADNILSENMDDMDDHFAFIAGYTPGGFPYGTTWEELGIDPALPLEEKERRYRADTPSDPEKAIDDSELPF